MNHEQVKRAADVIGRLEALEAAYKAAEFFPHEALPISFPSVIVDEGEDSKQNRLLNDVGTKAFYPRCEYLDVLEDLIDREEGVLASLGVTQ